MEHGSLGNWERLEKNGRPIWFQIIEKIQNELSGLGVAYPVQKEIIHNIKHKAIRALPVRGNMLNLREKHIPRMEEIYRSVAGDFINLG